MARNPERDRPYQARAQDEQSPNLRQVMDTLKALTNHMNGMDDRIVARLVPEIQRAAQQATTQQAAQVLAQAAQQLAQQATQPAPQPGPAAAAPPVPAPAAQPAPAAAALLLASGPGPAPAPAPAPIPNPAPAPPSASSYVVRTSRGARTLADVPLVGLDRLYSNFYENMRYAPRNGHMTPERRGQLSLNSVPCDPESDTKHLRWRDFVSYYNQRRASAGLDKVQR